VIFEAVPMNYKMMVPFLKENISLSTFFRLKKEDEKERKGDY
jgi:hypothetical protein